MPLGQELRRIRKELGYTMEEASNSIGISRQYLSMIERDIRVAISFDIICVFSEVYQVPLDYIKRIRLEDGPINTTEELLEWNKINNKIDEGYKYTAYNKKTEVEQQELVEEQEDL
jgi:transcriptional regulator with XRE-family HTH domain